MKLWLKLPFSVSSVLRSPPCLYIYFLLTLPPVLPQGISSTAYRWAATADNRRRPRWEKAALPREESGCSVTLQTETQSVGQLPREEGWGAQQHERLTVCKWAWSGLAGMKCALWKVGVSVCTVTVAVHGWPPVSRGSFKDVLNMSKLCFRECWMILGEVTRQSTFFTSLLL